MTQIYAWALCQDGKIIDIYKSELGSKRGLSRFTKGESEKERRRWRVARLKCLFDELEPADDQQR